MHFRHRQTDGQTDEHWHRSILHVYITSHAKNDILPTEVVRICSIEPTMKQDCWSFSTGRSCTMLWRRAAAMLLNYKHKKTHQSSQAVTLKYLLVYIKMQIKLIQTLCNDLCMSIVTKETALSYPWGPKISLIILVDIPCESPTLSPLVAAVVALLCNIAWLQRQVICLFPNIIADGTAWGGFWHCALLK